jgi:hypothetical protein
MKQLVKLCFWLMVMAIGIYIAVSSLKSGDGKPEISFHPNGSAIGSIGAVVCPDSPHARAGLSDKAWDESLEDSEKRVQAGGQLRAPDLKGDNCSTLTSGTPVYIENVDSGKMATVTAQLPDGTTVHGITRSDMVSK